MNWKEENNNLSAVFKFTDFKEALDFVNKVGKIAETMNHHPDIYIKNYNTVTISSTTHDKGNAITDKDRILAKNIDDLF
jgi:4a-hydroxytetrahydrobiopterin dehydratase